MKIELHMDELILEGVPNSHLVTRWCPGNADKKSSQEADLRSSVVGEIDSETAVRQAVRFRGEVGVK